jgi:predicted RecA/RadA family phage recombinase
VTNFYAPGLVWDYANTGGSNITSGSTVMILSGANGMGGIAKENISNNTTGAVAIGGVFTSLAKPTAEAWVAGQKVYYASVSNYYTSNTVTGSNTNYYAGRTYAAAASATATGTICLNIP